MTITLHLSSYLRTLQPTVLVKSAWRFCLQTHRIPMTLHASARRVTTWISRYSMFFDVSTTFRRPRRKIHVSTTFRRPRRKVHVSTNETSLSLPWLLIDFKIRMLSTHGNRRRVITRRREGGLYSIFTVRTFPDFETHGSRIDPRFEHFITPILKNTMRYRVRELVPPGGEFSNPIPHSIF